MDRRTGLFGSLFGSARKETAPAPLDPTAQVRISEISEKLLILMKLLFNAVVEEDSEACQNLFKRNANPNYQVCAFLTH